jgi:membrane protein required for colicin V production
MTPLLFDVLIIGAVLLSAGIGFLRGFCNEIFTIVGWIAAIVATIYFTPVVKPLGRELIEKAWLADITTATVIFLGVLGIVTLISYFTTKSLHQTKLGIVDRAGGFFFGIARAVVLFGLGFLLIAYVWEPEDRPDFIKEAKSRPFLEASASWTQAVIPIWEDKLRISESDPPVAEEGPDKIEELTKDARKKAEKKVKKKLEEAQDEVIENLGK